MSFFPHLSGGNLPEEHCKYTKQSFLSPRLCLSHITHPLLTHHTYNVVQSICFFFYNVHSAQFLTPYVSLLGVIKVFSSAAHFCLVAVIIVRFTDM